MSRTVRVTPAGHLAVEEDSEAEPALGDSLANELDEAVGESSARGLLWLVARASETPLPPVLVFWREFGSRFFQAVCHLGEDVAGKFAALEPPGREELEGLIAEAPPMRGLEYLTPDVLRNLWHGLHELALEEATRAPEGIEAWLRDVTPLWRLLGRVTFHLAENRKDEERPFAFLATYTHRVSAAARVQHLPLAQALKDYAGARNQSRLTALLEPVRRAADRSPLVRELLESRALFQPQAWSIRQAYRFLKDAPQLEEAGVVVRVPNWWNARRPTRPQVQVRLGQKPETEGSLLDFSLEVALDGEPLTEEERQAVLQAGEGLTLLRGRWVEVDREKLAQVLGHWRELQSMNPDGISFIQGMRLLAGTQLEAEAAEAVTPEWSQVVAGDWLRQTLQTIRSPEKVTGIEPGKELQAVLRPYQAEGVRWLWFMTRLGLGACLADDMGLGKTIQVIDLLLQLRKGDAAGETARPSLLVIPASLIGNWKQELERFAPSLRVLIAHRSECDAETLAAAGKAPQQFLADRDLVITTYGFVRRMDWVAKTPWRLAILDEAQAIKNASSAQTRAVKKLDTRGRIVLTGTPVENHLGDLWSIFDFCSPGLLGSATQFKAFVKRLNRQQDAAAFGALRRLVRPYILRRLKTDPNIVPDLPDKTEMHVDCGLSRTQAVLYEQAVADLAKKLKVSEGIERRGLVLAVLMQLKQICNHPSQFLNAAAFAPGDSGKFGRLEAICEPIRERQEKVLVFTQFQALCDPLAEYLATLFGRPGLVLTGKTAIGKRAGIVREFQSDEGPPFFVISLKAGGSGLNLTAASHVIHFDRWWNPAVENQATDRAFRIGQRRNVLVHKFVCRGTLEERIDQMIRDKRDVADRLLDEGAESKLTEMSDEDLLRFVAIDLDRASEE